MLGCFAKTETMANSLPDQILHAIETVRGLYHRLVIVVGPSGTGKTPALQDVARRVGATRINLNLELSQRLMNLTARQRILQLRTLLDEVLASVPGDILIFDNIEMLFDVALQQDPLYRLQAISRNRTVVVAWNGIGIRDDRGQASLMYAVLGHPEYRRYSAADLVLVESAATP